MERKCCMACGRIFMHEPSMRDLCSTCLYIAEKVEREERTEAIRRLADGIDENVRQLREVLKPRRKAPPPKCGDETCPCASWPDD